jgi:hypothetical protein
MSTFRPEALNTGFVPPHTLELVLDGSSMSADTPGQLGAPIDNGGLASGYTEPSMGSTTPSTPTVISRNGDSKTSEGKLRIRPATEADIDAIVDVDLTTFESVYSTYTKERDELRTELREKFALRLSTVGGDWMPVLLRGEDIVGLMTCCPTSKSPEDFKSWEETTDDGTLETTYDSDGNNVYVVTLSVLPEGSEGKNMLFAHQIGKAAREGYKLAYFESRLPGLREWIVANKLDGSEDGLAKLSSEQKDEYADEYFELHEEVKGKQVRKDRLIRLYERVGCKCLKLVADAYDDEPSLDYGVVCTYTFSDLFNGSALPFKIPENRLTHWLVGSLVQIAARSPKVSNKVFNQDPHHTLPTELAPNEAFVIQKEEGSQPKGIFETMGSWLKRRKLSLAIGASILSMGVGIAINPDKKVLREVETKAEWVIPTELALDMSIGVGVTMMLSSAGIAIRNPLKAKKYLKELPERANNSRLFRSGFALSTASAVAWGGVAIGAILTTLPPQESLGALTFPVVDLASTVASRAFLWNSIQAAADRPQQTDLMQ